MVSQKVKKQVVDYLQRAIVAGQLPPEKKLIETEIAEKLQSVARQYAQRLRNWLTWV